MDCNGLLWIFRNPVNGFEDTSMDCYGVFSGRRPDYEIIKLVLFLPAARVRAAGFTGFNRLLRGLLQASAGLSCQSVLFFFLTFYRQNCQ